MLVCYHICINSFLLPHCMNSFLCQDSAILLSCYFHIKVFTSIAVSFKKLITILYQDMLVLFGYQQERHKRAQEK